MKKDLILFVTHKPKQCGVYEFGKSLFEAIAVSTKYQFVKAECDSLQELKKAVLQNKPQAIIYNYHPSVMPWLTSKTLKGVYKNHVAEIDSINIGIIHEVTQEVADTATGYRNKYILGDSQKKLNSLFDYYIAPDPTLLLKNPLVFKIGRLIPNYNKALLNNPVPAIGSFGFATPKKGFEKLVTKVQQEFDEAIIRLNIPAADFGDNDGSNARQIAATCKSLITKDRIKLEITHNYLNNEQLLDFLASNSINVFLYEDKNGRGISSTVDNALAVRRPIAVSNSPMFRHILEAAPISVEERGLKAILEDGFEPLSKLLKTWDAENLKWEFERILDRISFLTQHPFEKQVGLTKKAGNFVRKNLTLPNKSFSWLRNTSKATEDPMSRVVTKYDPIKLDGAGFNRILDDSARSLYQPAVNKLFELAPLTMSKKIDRANVQQAFVFDTVYRHINNYNSPKMLCVGSYEDTASMGLIRMGYQVEEIDPMINFFLQEYYTKPTTLLNSYQIIFSTSVIEHDPDDESFMKCIEGLLAPGGIAVITCDYKDGWEKGQPKPDVDARFYTKEDLEQRLLSYIPNCELIDNPNWDCPNPDFNYLGKYQYTFATFCIRKK